MGIRRIVPLLAVAAVVSGGAAAALAEDDAPRPSAPGATSVGPPSRTPSKGPLPDGRLVKMPGPYIPNDATRMPVGWRDPSTLASELFDAPVIEADLVEALGSRYGGMWVNGNRFDVAVVDPAESDHRRVESYGNIVPARFSMADLVMWRDEASRVMHGHGDSVVYADLRSNKVVVVGGRSHEVAPALQKLAPAGAIEVRGDPSNS